MEADDQMLMLARLHNGALGTIEASKIATGAEDELRFEIHGDKGGLRFNLMDLNYLEAYDLREPETPLGGQRGWRKIATVQRYEKPAASPAPNSPRLDPRPHALPVLLPARHRGGARGRTLAATRPAPAAHARYC